MGAPEKMSLRVTAQLWWEITAAGFWVTLLNRLWRIAQSRTAKKVRVYQDIVFARQEGVVVRLDLYLPSSPPPPDGYPVVIALHGGAWCTGNKRDMSWVGYLLAQRGVAVVCAGYRLAPAFRYPAQWHDCQAAVAWVRQSAEEWQLNPHWVTALGVSSGGHLALLLGLREEQWNGIPTKVERVVAIFPPTDLTAPYYQQAALNPPPLVPNYLRDFLGGTYEEMPERWRDASPIYHVHPNAAPCFIIHGTRDSLVPVDQAKRFVEAMQRVGAKVTLVLIDGLGHGYSLRPRIMSQLHTALDEAIRFLTPK